MGMLGRYQKQNGFSQLLALIEGFGPEKRVKFLELIREENSTWADAIDSKMLTVEKICSWHSDMLREIFSRLRPLTVSVALHGISQESRERVFSVLGLSQSREIRDLFEQSTPAPGEILAVFMKIISEVRGMEAQGLIRFEKIDRNLMIPDDFEQQLEELSKSNSTQNTLNKFHASLAEKGSPLVQLNPNSSTASSISNEASPAVESSPRATSKDKTGFDGFTAAEGAKLYQQLQTLTKQVQLLQEENHLLKATLEQINRLTKVPSQVHKKAA